MLKNKSIPQACAEALERLNIPRFSYLKGAELDDLIYSWRQRRYDFALPEKTGSKKLSFAPPPLSPAQSEVLDRIKAGEKETRYSAQTLETSISTLRSLWRKGYVEGGGEKTKREEEVWKITELKL